MNRKSFASYDNHDRRQNKKKSKKQRLEKYDVHVSVMHRHKTLLSAIAHLGPTNSGKTHDAIHFLLEQGQGVFAAPLRMLAKEAYEKMKEIAGEEQVGLLTGEESINPYAPILACTTEMAPMKGNVLVLDEVHWASDPERGQAWMKLMVGGNYDHIRLLGASDAYPLLKHIFQDDLEVRWHERLTELQLAGGVDINNIEDKTVIVAFSRKTVLWLAAKLSEIYGANKICALYGAMPVQSRKEQINKFIEGEASICVATDVIGHGINLPCKTVLFAEDNKFDGQKRRPLYAWEIAQIAGRAGRYGHHEQGYVGVLQSQDNLINCSSKYINRSLEPKVKILDDHYGYRVVDKGCLRPSLYDLNCDNPIDLEKSLLAWQQKAQEEFRNVSWLKVEETIYIRQRLQLIRSCLPQKHFMQLELEDVWKLANAPLDVDNPADKEMMVAFTKTLSGQKIHFKTLFGKKFVNMSLLEAEKASRIASAIRWFIYQWPHKTTITDVEAEKFEMQAAKQVSLKLNEAIKQNDIGQCQDCNAPVSPWKKLCEECYYNQMFYNDQYYN